MNKKYAGLDFPAWFDGKDANEAAFCREFLSKNKLIYADNAFFTPDGRLTAPLLLKEKIYAELECCAAKNIPRTISNIVEIMKLAAHTESFPPKPDEIHVQNGTLRVGDTIVAGTAMGHIRAMMDDKGRRVKEAGPSQPVRESRLSGCGFFPICSTRRTSQPFRSISAIASFPAPKGSA